MKDDRSTASGIGESILREQVRLAVDQLPTMQIASFLVAVVLSFVVREFVPDENIAIWLSLVALVAVSRIIFYYRFVGVSKGPFDGRLWRKAYLLLALASGVIWGLSAFLIFPVQNIAFISLFVLVIASLSAATTISHSSLRLGPAAWAFPAMLLYATRCFIERGAAEYTIGLLIVLYLIATVIHSFKHNKLITSAISLKFENIERESGPRVASSGARGQVDFPGHGGHRSFQGIQ